MCISQSHTTEHQAYFAGPMPCMCCAELKSVALCISRAPHWSDQQSKGPQLSLAVFWKLLIYLYRACVCVCVRTAALMLKKRKTCSSRHQLEIGHPFRVHIYQDASENLNPITSWEQCQSCLTCVQNVYTGIYRFLEHQQLSKPAKQNKRTMPMRFIHNNLRASSARRA